MNHAVPVSANGGGETVTGPLPQFMVTSARTSALINATAGFARRMASCTVSPPAGRATVMPTAARRRARRADLIARTLPRRPAAPLTSPQPGQVGHHCRQLLRLDGCREVHLDAGEEGAGAV